MEFGRIALALVGHFLASLLYVLQRLHLVEAVVDSTSILEHREELRDLWEKRMMADENQSSSSSTVAETRPLKEEDSEEKVVNSECESSVQSKMANGVVKHAEVPDSNANHILESTGNASTEVQSVNADQENNNSADSLEEDNAEEYAEQKTYTSNLEQALVMTEVKEVTSETHSTSTVTTTVEEVHQTQEAMQIETQEVVTTTTSEVEKIESPPETVQQAEESIVKSVEEQILPADDVAVEKEKEEIREETKNDIPEVEKVEEVKATNEESMTPTPAEESVIQDHHEKIEALQEKIIHLEVNSLEEDDDGFVRVEECLPKDDNADVPLDLPEDGEEQTAADPLPSSNGFDDPQLPMSPTGSTASDKGGSHPEIEQFVKSGGIKRIIPGVQKTEQPYSTCTTETKIAMEIREMREREEELRVMRERAPVASPVPPPPKTPVSPVPPPKTPTSPALSPTPSQGPGYRVSSVFGHHRSSPVEEEKNSKRFAKESAVEREIRLAKEREEELRNQKGLPPREDDSYVKPSQVKNCQVRVFSKMAGSNSSVKQAATAKIQMEIEEQTQREMALRETGSIQTISQERTDARVAKLKTETQTNGTSHPPVNGSYTNGRSSPEKRSSPSPTNVARPASIFAQSNGVSMHKFIASKGRESTFSAPRPLFQQQAPKEESTRAVPPPPVLKLKRNASVESKIQQEIMEMKMREEELKKLHMKMNNGNSVSDENGTEHEMNQKNNFEYENGNGNGISDEEISPRHNKLIAQWEQRIQKAES